MKNVIPVLLLVLFCLSVIYIATCQCVLNGNEPRAVVPTLP